MKSTFVAIAIIFSFNAQGQEDYVIQLNDTLINVTLEKQYNLVVKGEKIRFKISSKDTLLYTNNFYSFFYTKDFKVANSKVDAGIDQTSILTSEGSGMLIQKYESINPTTLNEMMLNELTKESISYGYKSERSTYKRKLISGQEIEITRAVLRYKDDINIYEIGSIGKKDAGILIITMRMDEDGNSQGQKVIDLMWKSIKVN